MSAVEGRDGQDIQDREIGAEEGQEDQQSSWSARRFREGRFGDRARTSQIRKRDASGDQALQEPYDPKQLFFGFPEAQRDRFSQEAA